MALARPGIITQRRALIVPRGFIALDLAHPLMRGVQSFYVPGSSRGGMDYGPAGVHLGSNSATSLKIDKRGPGLEGQASNAFMWATATPIIQLAPPITLFYSGEHQAGARSGNALLIGHSLDVSAAPYAGFQIGIDGSGNIPIGFFGNGGGWAVPVGTTNLPTSGSFSVAAFATGTTSEIWYKGVLEGTAGGSAGITYTAGKIGLGGDQNTPTRIARQHTYAGAVFNVQKTPDEIRWFDAEPFAAFKTRTITRYYVGAAAAGGSTATLAGIASTSAVGSPTANLSNTLSGIASTSAVGSPTANFSNTLSGIASTSAVGTPTANLSNTLAGIASTSAVGSPTASVTGTATLAGIASTSAVGTPTANLSNTLAGIPSTSAVGSPTGGAAQTATASGIASTSSVGSPTASLSNSLAGIASTSAVGSPQAHRTALLAGIASTSAVGSPAASFSQTRTVAGIASTSAVGSPTVRGFRRASSRIKAHWVA